MQDVRGFLERLFSAAVAAAQPERVLADFLPEPPTGRTLVLGAGKAASAMARVVDATWPQDMSGLVVTRYGQGMDCGRIEVVEAAHPVPDLAGQQAARRMLDLCRDLNADDLVLALISGGGSALLSLPGGDIELAEKQELNRQLLECGASITEINTLRKHISAIKGGRLAAACHPAKVVSLLISDVPGDDPQVIASGPTLPDPSTAAQARAIIDRYQLTVADSIRQFLLSEQAETPGPADPRFEGDELQLVAAPQISLQAAAAQARSEAVPALILSDCIEGEAREIGKAFAAIARQAKFHNQPIAPPCVILSGGETTVSIKGNGKGGPNTEFNLAMALALAGESGITALACDTDGIDGSEDNAGCIIDETSLARARERGLDPAGYLENNDAWTFFDAIGDLVVTGPTHTNVNDLRAIYVAAPNDPE
ncbi:MAG: glycerate kinase [Gammaproteobacteria bacterium]|nr:glycerate kinase [Gammaproteobacteria bacterium]